MLLAVLTVVGVFPVAELLLKPIFGGISRDSLVGCVSGGLDRVLFSRLELDESERPLIAPLDDATCKELRALCCCVDCDEVEADAMVTQGAACADEEYDNEDDVEVNVVD